MKRISLELAIEMQKLFEKYPWMMHTQEGQKYVEIFEIKWNIESLT